MKTRTRPAKSARLPEWDLRDFYTAPDSPEVTRDLGRAAKESEWFSTKYAGKVANLDSVGLVSAISDYEDLQELMGKLGSYAQLMYAGDLADVKIAQFQQNISEQLTQFSSQLIFFALEINLLEDDAVKNHLTHPDVARYAPWIREVRVFRPYQLSQELEKILHEKSITGRAAWARLFEETIAGLRFPIGNKQLPSAQAFDLLSSPKAPVRKAAAKSIAKVLGNNIKGFALITNTLAKDKEIEDVWRKFAKPVSSRNLANQVEDEVVEALISTVRRNYPRLSHRYYKLKAKWFGKKQLNYWDRNAPLPKVKERSYNWPQARDLVLDSYRAFSPKLADLGQKFFDNPWIDVPARPNKSPGAFAHPTVPSVHPYLLLNFLGKTHDVMTLAHELGHGVHQLLAAKQGVLLSDTPLTLAETASVFGEQLAFREILSREKDAKIRHSLIAGKVEDMLNTVVRQVAFCEFETRVHDERRKGELTPDRIGRIWLDIQTESLGAGVKLEPEYSSYWSYIPHFIHTPFYVYAYAFGDCLVNSLYARYQHESKAGRGKDFEQKYLAMLEAGGTLRHRELLAPFGLNASDPAFWQEGLDVISGFIDELEG